MEILRSAAFDSWLRKLRDAGAKARILVRITRLSHGNAGDTRPVGGGVSEMRIDYGPGYRVYFKQQGERLALLLCGGMDRQMKKQSFSTFDTADYLKTEAEIAAYLDAASEDGDPKVLVSAIGDVIRARNVSKIARDAGLTREGLYKAFSSGGNPGFATVMKVARALDLELAFRSRAAPGTKRTAPRRRAAPR